MSKATWDEEVEFEDKNAPDVNNDNMVLNPKGEEEEEVEWLFDENPKDHTEEEEEEKKEDQLAPKIDEIKYKLKAYEKLRRQNHAQSELMRRLKAERDHFQAKAFEQYESNLAYNEGLIQNKLEIAKAQLELAIEEGQAAEVAEKNIEIASLTSDLREQARIKENWENSKAQEDNLLAARQKAQETTNNQNINWFYSNPEFNPQNPSFDKKLQKEFISYAKEIDEELINQGKGAVIGSPEYYDYFENIMDSYRNKARAGSGPEAVESRKVTRGKSFNPVSPVSRGNTAGGLATKKSKTSVYISPEEARINKLWGITPKEHVEFSREWSDKDFEMEGY